MKNSIISFLCGMALLLTGCAAERVAAPELPLLPGSVLHIQKPLTLPAGSTRIYFQFGLAGRASSITVWEHHCSLILETDQSTAYEIPAHTEWPVASVQRLDDFGIWEKGVINYRTLISFDKTAYPVTALECELWHEGYDPQAYITRSELGKVLGRNFSFE